jgi:hypothetical protein
MKKLIGLLAIALFATTALAQKTAGRQAPPDVQISYRFDPGIDRTKINRTNLDGKLVNRVSPTDDGPEGLYRATITIRNNGSKTVKAVTWAVVFINLDTQKEVEHQKHNLRKSIAPGAERTLLPFIKESHPPGTITVQAVIDRVEYDDGSVWQHS